MHIRVLGSAAGGGFPQWNCNCRNCAGVRTGTLRARPRTQSSIFVSADAARDWILFNASPDILTQMRANPALQPARAVRDTAIARRRADRRPDRPRHRPAHAARARPPLPLWCTEPVAEDLSTGHPMLRVLDHYCGVAPAHRSLDGSRFPVAWRGAAVIRARCRCRARPAPYSPHRDEPGAGRQHRRAHHRRAQRPQRSSTRRAWARSSRAVFDAMAGADCVLVDGTFWTDDEMMRLGLSSKTRARHRPPAAERAPAA